ncbi:MAG: hypothetical protein HDT26_01065 [Subdoligranulum sp.]|nr:hypothetical protein [Subdoligranulum sp.]
MKKDGKYRYSLQFGADSEEEVRAGELLERLGNKKSVVIIAALNAYIASHPDLKNAHSKIEVQVDFGQGRTRIEEIVRSVVEEKLRSLQLQNDMPPTTAPVAPIAPIVPDEKTVELLEADVAQMLDNLNLF